MAEKASISDRLAGLEGISVSRPLFISQWLYGDWQVGESLISITAAVQGGQHYTPSLQNGSNIASALLEATPDSPMASIEFETRYAELVADYDTALEGIEGLQWSDAKQIFAATIGLATTPGSVAGVVGN